MTDEHQVIPQEEAVSQKLDDLNQTMCQFLDVVKSQAERQGRLEEKMEASEQAANEKDLVVNGPEDFKCRFGAFIKVEAPDKFLERCLKDEAEDVVTPWMATLPPGSRETVSKLIVEKIIPASGISQRASKMIKADDT